MIEDHVGMSCVWIACCMIEKISKDCKIELCGLLAHSTVHTNNMHVHCTCICTFDLPPTVRRSCSFGFLGGSCTASLCGGQPALH